MKLSFFYPRWGSDYLDWNTFLFLVKDNNYAGVEIGIPSDKREKDEILMQIKEHDLKFIAQHWETKEANFKKHKEQFKKRLYNLAETEPLFINSHTGLDFFSFSENVELLELAHYIEQETKVIISHETHRSRFSFAAHICLDFINELPFLKLTSDFSHWCCVAESLLENQSIAIQKAIEHTFHIHARVGSSQSAQVIDPRVDTYKTELNQFLDWWKSMIKNAENSNKYSMAITPEYGPFPYSCLHPRTKEPLANQWEINQFIKGKISN